MIIKGTRILNIEDRLKHLPAGSDIRVAVIASAEAISKAGLGDKPAVGDTALPPVVGPVTRFNALGKWLVHKDRGLESRYIRTVMWRWKQWVGRDDEEHEDEKDIYRDCYPRELITPPSVELTLVEMEGQKWLVTPKALNRAENFELLKHMTNLLLELFGSCELVGADLADAGKTPIRHVNWQLLPPGKYPWERLKEQMKKIISRISPQTGALISNRQETIQSYGPDEIYAGQGGFQGYLAYVFPKRGIVILESVRIDNAIYIFGEGWKTLSQLTKAEIIAGNLQIARIVHSKGWREQLATVMNRSAAAE